MLTISYRHDYFPAQDYYCILGLQLQRYHMYESRKQKLAPLRVFYQRMAYHIFIACVLLAFCLAIGVVGYHITDGVPWIDALHNASMILSGMGPVVEIKSVGGKLFSSAYALFSGVAFITNIGIILAPAAHRLFHRLHVDDNDH